MVLERYRSWSRRRRIVVAGAGLVAAAIVGVIVALLVVGGDSPPPPSVTERIEALSAAAAAEPSPVAPAEPLPPAAPASPGSGTAPDATPGAAPASPPSDASPAATPPSPEPPAPESPPPEDPTPEPAPEPEPATSPAPVETDVGSETSLDGVWAVDTTLGGYEDYSSSWAGYRVGEELAGIGATEAVGRTPVVSGSLEMAGLTAVAALVEVDLTTLVSDRPQRDGLVRQALDTQRFGMARFELTEPVAFESLPAAGEAVTATAVGTFTAHGTSRPVEATLTASWLNDVIVVGGAFEIRFEDYGILPPRVAVVLSVADVATVEFLLNFTR